MAWYDIAPGYSAKAAAGDFLGEFVNQVQDQYSPKAIARSLGDGLGRGSVSAAKENNPLTTPALILAGAVALGFILLKRK